MHKLHIHINFKSLFLTFTLMIASTLLAFCLFELVPDNPANIALVYILALILAAQYTDGYLYGILFSLFSVVCVNYFFTYPFFILNFTLTGYPITFLIMFTITIITSTATSHLKIQAKLLAEREEIVSKAEKEKMRANLLRAISHDLRTPLTSIIGESSSYFELTDTSASEERDDLVHRINDDAHWLLNMVENLLTVTRIQDTETAKVNKTLEVVEEIVSEAILRFKKRQPDAIVKAAIPEAFIMLPMDPLLIEQVIINLLDNAFVHSFSTREITLTITEDVPDFVSFHIRDYGKGIDPSLIESIFDGTGARSSDTPDAHRGMGIGLSICKTIIEAHNGNIFAKNCIDGAEFTFTLPKEQANDNLTS